MSHIIKCFLTVRPNELFYEFIKQLPDIENTYICIDDNNYNIPNYDGIVKIIKIDNKTCENAGFKNTHLTIKGSIARDKALYYFCKIDIKYDYVWFIEEDVFIPTTETIKNIDIKYPDQDLLVRNHELIYKYKTNWHWKLVNSQLNGKINLPYAWACGAGICALRCSKKMLQCIYDHVLKYKSLFFDEVLFNIIALHNKLDVKDIDELKGILWRKHGGFKKYEIKSTDLYHPVKSIEDQYKLRTKTGILYELLHQRCDSYKGMPNKCRRHRKLRFFKI